jgi:predicted PhzF superfamily epimerase YddE/YHI9
VTIFSTDQTLSRAAQTKLARACEWESVIIHWTTNNNDDRNCNINQRKLPELSFYMPSGEQVSFCAHAAMGATRAIVLHKRKNDGEAHDDVTYTVADIPRIGIGTNESPSRSSGRFKTEKKDYKASFHTEDNVVALHMEAIYKQEEVSRPSLLSQVLLEHCAVENRDLLRISNGNNDISTTVIPKDSPLFLCCHATIARPKTLVPIKSTRLLNEKAVAPTEASKFAQDCQALNDTTGLYLYAQSDEEENAWECRQFPRASGYPEDPATGIAAAALVCHLKSQQGVDLPSYKVYQGLAMQKPSLIVVDEVKMIEKTQTDRDGGITMGASFRLLGHVEIDEYDLMEFDNEIL